MIQNKRNQFRSQLRKSQLHSLFQYKRKEIIEGGNSIFKALDHQIYSQENIDQEQLCKNIINCLKEHPQEQNSYILVNNYLNWNKHQYCHFFTLLTQSSKYLQNQMLCLKTVTCILDELLTVQTWNQKDKIEQMEQIMLIACEVVGEVYQKLKRFKYNSTQKQKQGNIWSYFIQILRIQLNNNMYNNFPLEAIISFNKILSILHINQNNGSTQQKMEIWYCVKDIYLNINLIQIRKQLFQSSCHIFWDVLKHNVSQRQQCLDILLKLLINYSIDFMAIFFNQPIIVQILYLFDQNNDKKTKLAFFIKQTVSMCNFDQLVFLVNKGAHKLLTNAMAWSMQNFNNECLEHCMGALYFMLGRFRDIHQQKAVKRILSDIQILHFDQMLDGMIQEKQNDRIQKCLNLLVDEYYSEDSPL